MNAWPIELLLLGSGRWSGLPQRLGLRLPVVQPGAVWIHGASLGEAKIGRRLADAMQPALLTTDTRAGREVASSYRPLDHPWTLAPLWAEARPSLLIFVESAWWPALATLAKKSGVPIITVAARPSRTTVARGYTLGWPDAVFARDAIAADFFRTHTKVLGICGTLKHAKPTLSPLQWTGPFLVAASARRGDVKALIRARDRVCPHTAILAAPRHKQPVMKGFVRRSTINSPIPPGQDVWLDTVGELASCLVGAQAALIGGTFDASIGGHSPTEARAAGVRFVHGPHIHANKPDFIGGALAHDPHGLPEALRRCLEGPPPPPPEDTLSDVVRALRPFRVRSTESSPRPWAIPLQPLQRLGTWLRTQRHIGAHVIAVGSRNARGAGKTTTTAFIAAGLQDLGHRVLIITRGVGRRPTRTVGDSRVHGPDPLRLGDEGAALALQGFWVRAHPNRARASHPQAAIILLEDGLFCGVHADVRVESIDSRFPTGRGLIPAGESRALDAHSDLTIAHYASSRFPAPPDALIATRSPGAWSQPVTSPYVAFAGIGRPADFFATLDADDVRAFPDHHRYTAQDRADLLRWANGRTLVTTDRDAVRVPGLGVRWRGVTLTVPDFPWGSIQP